MKKLRKLKATSSLLTLFLVFVALIALIEKGPPPVVYLNSEASAVNPGPLGLFNLVKELESRYKVNTLFSLNRTAVPKSDVCVYVIVSPSRPYTASEAITIYDIVSSSCRRFSLLVADEFNTSNKVLEVFGFSVRIPGEVVLDSQGSPYPLATLYVGDKGFFVRLDIASRVEGGVVAGRTLEGVAIAAYEKRGENTTYVIGDGSIFLNQALAASNSVYKEFALTLFDYLCNGNSGCQIIIDDTHRQGEEPAFQNLWRALMGFVADPVGSIITMMTVIARLIHPSTWFPPLVTAFNSLTAALVGNSMVYPLLLAILMFLAYRIISARIPAIRDEPLPEQEERELFITGDIRRAVIAGKIKFSKNDFVKLYEVVSEVLKNIKGVGLDDSRTVDVLASVIGAERASRFVNDMNRLYLKASGKKILPIVLSWNRATKKKIDECEEVLKALGTSLAVEKGVEYVLARGVMHV